MLTENFKYSAEDKKLWSEFELEQRIRREEFGRGWNDGYAEGCRVGLQVAGTGMEKFFK